ncbi:flippase [uncultured Methanocorpusculum sp.]|nr:flippase [uncultured Methanocorpusculum sp.]
MRIPAIQRQSAISIISTIGITFFGFISTMLFSHLLGKDLMGVYYLFLAYYGIFNMIGDGGFGQAAIKRISEGKEQNEYLSAYATLRAILMVVSTLLLLVLSPIFVDLQSYNLIPWIIAALAASFFGHTITYGICGLGHVGINNVASGISDFFRILVQIVAVLLGFSVFGLCGGFIVGIIIFGILCLKYFTFKPAKFTVHHIGSLTKYGFWIFLIGTGSIVFAYSDTIFIGYFMNNGDVGVYLTAYQFTQIATLICAAIVGALTPKISYWSANNWMDKIAPVVARGITMSLLLAIPVAFGGLLLSERLLYYFYGADFATGATVCSILLIMQIVAVFTYLMGLTLTASDHARQSFYATASAAIVNITLNIILIPIMGINGATIATFLSYTLNAILISYYLKSYIAIYVELLPITHIIIASIVMTIFVFIYMQFIPLDNVVVTLVPVVVGALIYVCLLFKLDRGIRDEIAGMVTTFGLPWPKWL